LVRWLVGRFAGWQVGWFAGRLGWLDGMICWVCSFALLVCGLVWFADSFGVDLVD
jgi:hypothetical protein